MCTDKRVLRLTLVLVFICLIFTRTISQTPVSEPDDPALPQATPSPSSKNEIHRLEKNFLRNILADQRGIWTAPFHLHSTDAKWGVPLTASFATLVATDRHTSGELVEHGENQNRMTISKDVSELGAVYTTGGLALGFYLFGRAEHNNHARETGLLAGEALIDGALVAGVLKEVSQRQRPPEDNNSGEFWDGGSSFPSGHAVSAWSVATIFAQEYGRRKPAVKIAAYGLASAVSVARYTGRNHFLSDVLVGSAIGYGIGRYVYHQHHDPALDSDGMTQPNTITHSHLFPGVTPLYSARLHTYGVGLRWSF